MRRWFLTLLSLSLSLWLGGIITLFIVVQTLFHTFANARTIAGTAAAGIFHAFERYQLGLAALSILSAFAWRLMPSSGPAVPRLKTGIFTLLALAAVAAAASTLFITPRIDALRAIGMTSSPEFARLHGSSMLLYVGESFVLLIAVLLMPSIIRRDDR